MVENLMDNTQLIATPELDKILGKTSSGQEFTSKVLYFKAGFTPAHPDIGETFDATRFLYKSLVPGKISVLGWIVLPDGNKNQIGVVFPEDTANGTHPVSNDTDKIYIVVSGDFTAHISREGSITILRDLANKTIAAEFEFYIVINDVKFTITDGKLYLPETP